MPSRRAPVSGVALFVCSLLSLCWPGSAQADGTVLRARGCGQRIFVASGDRVSIVRQTEGDRPAEEDTLVGDVSALGSRMLTDGRTGRPLSATVEENGLARAAAERRIAIRCRSPDDAVQAVGTVRRTANCGRRIFVESNGTYTVLEQLAGGAVAEGDQVSGDIAKPGRATLRDRESGATLTVFVVEFQLSSAAADARIARDCR